MLPEVRRFQQWLRRKNPHSSTHIHYTSDLKLFFAWRKKQPEQVTPADIDAFIDYSRKCGHATSTINRQIEIRD